MSAKTKGAAAADNDVSGPLKATVKDDNDGLPTAEEEQKSVQKLTRAHMGSRGPGKTQQQREKDWKQAVMDRMKADNKQDEINHLNAQNFLGDQKDPKTGALLDPTGQGQALDGKDAFGDMWAHGTPQFQQSWKASHGGTAPDADQVYNNYTWGKTDKSLAGAIMGHDGKGKHAKGQTDLMHDAAWQPVTSVKRRQVDGSTQSAHPDTNHYVVGSKRGNLIKVTFPATHDKAGNLLLPEETHYMPTEDTNPGSNFFNSSKQGNLGEMSHSAHADYGRGNDANVTLQSVGTVSNTGGASPPYDHMGGDHLTQDQWDEIGSSNYRNKDGTFPNTWDELDAARKAHKVNKPPAKEEAAPPKKPSEETGTKLVIGHLTTFHGEDAKNIGYANVASIHTAGGYMIQGSSTTFVGEECFPVSRVGDGTSDGMEAVSGAEDCFVGGVPV